MATIEISTELERHEMVKEKTKSRVHSADGTVFRRQFIDDKMEDFSAPTDINELNDK
ncbi:hypothetical protein HHI36_024184, partial [Cryptolaemus montrouzieri]